MQAALEGISSSVGKFLDFITELTLVRLCILDLRSIIGCRPSVPRVINCRAFCTQEETPLLHWTSETRIALEAIQP